VLVAATVAAPEFEEESEEESDEELDEEEELMALQQLQESEEAPEALSDKEGGSLADTESEEEVEDRESTNPAPTTEDDQNLLTEPAAGIADQPTDEPAAPSPSEDGLEATQLDKVEVPPDEQLASSSSAPSADKATKKTGKNSMYAQLLREEERQAKKQV
jgi:hypothetical protein